MDVMKNLASKFALSVALFFAIPIAGSSLGIELREVATGFAEPLYITHAGDGSGRIFVVEHAGTIRVIRDGKAAEKPFLDLSATGLDRVSRPKDGSDERGLLGLAFHPKFKENGRFFVNYTKLKEDSTIIAEYKVSASDPEVADPTEKIIMGPIPQPQWNHNGGMIAFGPDGLLYIGLGDGGFADDKGPGHNPKIGNGQDTTTLLGKILRIDVDRAEPPLAYAIPADNPFAGKRDQKGNRPEIYAWGLRNPWRFSFDRGTGRLFCGDVGQKLWEEIDIIVKGGNYGWRFMEGNHCFNPKENCESPDLILPIHEYDHSEEKGGLSVTGGYVYRGSQFPELQGKYVFADYSTSRIWTLEEKDGKWAATEHLRPGFYIPTFGEDEAGEVYLCSKFRGVIYQVTATGKEVGKMESAPKKIEKLVLSKEEWKKRLTPEQFEVLRNKGTERACTGELWKEKRLGTYVCAGCELELFRAGKKFESGTGWPSFWDPLPGAVESEVDYSHGMVRTEVHCARCDGHLGHVFEDGPPPTGLRYCINSVSMKFKPDANQDAEKKSE